MSETRLFIGRIPPQATREDLEDFFKGYGRILDCKVMNGFGFIELEDARDARDIVNDFPGKEFMGSQIVVEPARGERRRRENFRETAASKYPRPRRTGYRLIVENLSEEVSWQDLKDVMRQAGEPTFTDAHRQNPGFGVVEFSTEDDMRSALTNLNGEEIKGAAIALREDPNAPNEPLPEGPGFRSRSPPPRRRYPTDNRRGFARRDTYRPARDDDRRYIPRRGSRDSRDSFRRGGRDDYRRGPRRDDYRRPRADEYRPGRDDSYRPERDDSYRPERDDSYRRRDDYPTRDEEYGRDAYERSPSPRRERSRSPRYADEYNSYPPPPASEMQQSNNPPSYPEESANPVSAGNGEGQVAAEW
ncbi:mRNA export factor Srp2 [Schizosaccharomyces cryophilus OY26]|uniref:mRNA export factor Srp2 n=1 Tax=Schizosaccharomyces cryophilus (strain OY26 / ATCC MYA-4695 / CBS 11777 / NBRC 106824 / NRRL Y48691) TaxID=653667 RepID=S9W1N5_SCHCR|nr:mRNA export factor Srp2 [Schizosaccharomyces cryophilus OY26]EPY51925.1 mRNA export factor Srp2 [Schizosaccharomyces cryophilus OY26]